MVLMTFKGTAREFLNWLSLWRNGLDQLSRESRRRQQLY